MIHYTHPTRYGTITYRYVGPKRIADRVAPGVLGTPIRSAADVLRWVTESKQVADAAGAVVATFIVDRDGTLRVADRHREHVACAGSEPVLSAGEMRFELTGRTVRVAEASNQSTGYCPEPESWPAVASAFARAGLEAPPAFGLACVFRLCPACGRKNIVKDEVFECGVCGAALPAAYNCQEDASAG